MIITISDNRIKISCLLYRVLKSNNEKFSPLILDEIILASPKNIRKKYVNISIQSILKNFFLSICFIDLF
tara:strand:- start:51 stop:260 length:210 start_codon:yes stop_codon:yes gene_type:complete